MRIKKFLSVAKTKSFSAVIGTLRHLYSETLDYWFLADRTNGRAYATVLRLSVCLWRYVLWLNGAS